MKPTEILSRERRVITVHGDCVTVSILRRTYRANSIRSY